MDNYEKMFLEHNTNVLSEEEFNFYLEEYRNGSKHAKDILIVRNIRLVWNIVKGFDNIGLEMEDLISIGFIGLINCIDKFDVSKNIKFSTYASKCIFNEVLLYIRNSKSISTYVSLDAPITCDENDINYIDIIKDINIDIVDDYEKRDLVDYILGIIDDFSKRDKDIIKLYYGFIDGIPKTQDEIGCIYGISKARVSVIIKNNLRKIKDIILNSKQK